MKNERKLITESKIDRMFNAKTLQSKNDGVEHKRCGQLKRVVTPSKDDIDELKDRCLLITS